MDCESVFACSLEMLPSSLCCGKKKTKKLDILFPYTFSSLFISEAKSASRWLITDFTTPACKHSLVCLSVQCVCVCVCVCTLSSLMLLLHWALCHCQPFYLHHGLHIRLGKSKSKWMFPLYSLYVNLIIGHHNATHVASHESQVEFWCLIQSNVVWESVKFSGTFTVWERE